MLPTTRADEIRGCPVASAGFFLEKEMVIGQWSSRTLAGASVLTLAVASFAAEPATDTGVDVSTELRALKTRIAELESKQQENWLTQERTAQIRSIVEDVLKDSKTRGQFADGPDIGYKDGFFIQTPDHNYKLVVGGYVQIRYEFSQANATNGRSITRGVGNNTITIPDPGNSSGVDIRRARISFSGNALTPDLTYKLEGDFYGATGGALTVTDAYVAYRFNDQVRIKAGSFKVPFAKAELVSDPYGSFAERAEELAPFDPVRALGVSVYGDLIPNRLSYEVNVNDGGKNSNTLRQNDTVGLTPNLDNRMAFYARMQWAGSGKISDFAEESDTRKENREFVWMLGGAAGYDSQNASNNAFPSPQNGTSIPGLSNGNGFISPYALNGDIFRGTLDWSAKYQGLSINTAAYIQQVNANPGQTSANSTNPQPPGPNLMPQVANFFEWGAYGQVGYFVIPQKLELLGRAGMLATEGRHDIGEWYSVGANYYIYGQNLKVQSDVTYTPEAAYTDAAASLLQNTHDLTFRLQLQFKF
jgi:hypothetical protein